jgi:hypothetical protein
VTCRDILKKGAAGVRKNRLSQFPEWIRGPAQVVGEEIVLAAADAESYRAFDPEHSERLLFDLMTLETLDRRRAEAFATEHGLLWHEPTALNTKFIREPLWKWQAAAYDLKKAQLCI